MKDATGRIREEAREAAVALNRVGAMDDSALNDMEGLCGREGPSPAMPNNGMREVTHVGYSDGPRGGRAWFLTLSCGHNAARAIPRGQFQYGKSVGRKSLEAPFRCKCVLCLADIEDGIRQAGLGGGRQGKADNDAGQCHEDDAEDGRGDHAADRGLPGRLAPPVFRAGAWRLRLPGLRPATPRRPRSAETRNTRPGRTTTMPLRKRKSGSIARCTRVPRVRGSRSSLLGDERGLTGQGGERDDQA